MELLAHVKSLLESFVEQLIEVDSQSKLIEDVVKQANDLIDQLNDPFIVWQENINPQLLKQLSKFLNKLKTMTLIKSKLSKPALMTRSELLHSITQLNETLLYNHDIEIQDNYGEVSSPKATGLIKQLSVRQDELQSAIHNSIQKIDERTGEAERFIGRVEKVATQDIRQRASELRELHVDHLQQKVDESRKDLESVSTSAGVRLKLDVNKATEELVEQHQIKYDRLYSELKNQTQEQIQYSDESRSEFDRKVHDLNRVFDEHVIELAERFATEQTNHKAALLQSVKEEASNYQTLKNLLKEQLDEAKEIVGVLSKKAMAHEHLKQARHEAYAYWGFQSAGLLFLFFAILMSVAIFGDSLGLRLPWLTWLVEFSSSSGAIQMHVASEGVAVGGNSGTNVTDTASEASWFFKRISIVLLLTAPGLYLLKEAANHRAKENLYRQRGIQLASITPYLKELEESERNAIKKDLVKSFFSFHDGKADTQNVPDFLRDLKETTKIIRSIDRTTQPTSNNHSFVKRRRRQPQKARG